MGYNQQNPITNSDDDEKLRQIEAEVDSILNDIESKRTDFVNETGAIVNEIENTPEIPDIDPEDAKDEEELAKTEEEFNDQLDDAIIDLVPKEDEIPE